MVCSWLQSYTIILNFSKIRKEISFLCSISNYDCVLQPFCV